ncbi:MAG: septum site-determining protein MinC, partial [Paenibacillus sp.]|nr:septum site-determining protein MinC [Paenibacillus sp.]
MTAVKHHVTIKGVKDGLVFLLDDTCEFADVIL